MEIYKRKSEDFFRFNTEVTPIDRIDIEKRFSFTSISDISSETLNNTQAETIEGYCRFEKLCLTLGIK